MGKKVLIISSTPRKEGNSQILCEAFKRGAEEAGHNVELIALSETKINYCVACYGCQETDKCVQRDSMNEILDKVEAADVLVFGTPIYFYDVCGQLKVFIDRLLPRYEKIQNKEMYLIATCADKRRDALNGTINTIDGFLDCVSNVEMKGIVYGTGLHNSGEARGSIKERETYEMGLKV